MRVGSWGSVAAVAALLALSLPVRAQDAVTRTTFDGVGFSFDQALGKSVTSTHAPATEGGVVAPEPPHIASTLYATRPEDITVPRPRDVRGVLRFYRIADFAGFDYASQQLEDLRSLLEGRPDLAPYMSGNEGEPFLPYLRDPSAAQYDARARYVDTPELAGVAYLTAFRQDVYPFTAGDFSYTFQGLSKDGSWYVAVDVAVDTSMFPRRVSQKDADRLVTGGRFPRYLRRSIESLNAAAPDGFAPPLASIDALVRSITFETVPAVEPSLIPSPS